MLAPVRLSQYPHARLRVSCGPCNREGCYSIARLAERHGAEIPLTDLLAFLARNCKWKRWPKDPPPRPYQPRCLACFPDLRGPG